MESGEGRDKLKDPIGLLKIAIAEEELKKLTTSKKETAPPQTLEFSNSPTRKTNRASLEKIFRKKGRSQQFTKRK